MKNYQVISKHTIFTVTTYRPELNPDMSITQLDEHTAQFIRVDAAIEFAKSMRKLGYTTIVNKIVPITF